MANLTAEEFYQEVESFARTEVAPGAEAREQAGEIDHALIKKMGARGLLAVNVSKELGGEGAGVVAYANAVKRIAEADASIAVTMAVTNMVGEVIQQFGTDAQKNHYCPKLASGEFFAGAFALSEPGSGSDAASLQTKALREGDDWVITGQKMWITSGTEAGVFVVWARTSGSGAKGITCFLVDKGATGLEIGKPEHKMGLKASHTVPLTLEAVRVSDDAILGREGDGFKIAMVALDGGRIGISSQATGIATAARNRLVQRLKADQVDQAVEFGLADIEMRIQSGWLLALQAASLKESGQPFSSKPRWQKSRRPKALIRSPEMHLSWPLTLVWMSARIKAGWFATFGCLRFMRVQVKFSASSSDEVCCAKLVNSSRHSRKRSLNYLHECDLSRPSCDYPC